MSTETTTKTTTEPKMDDLKEKVTNARLAAVARVREIAQKAQPAMLRIGWTWPDACLVRTLCGQDGEGWYVEGTLVKIGPQSIAIMREESLTPEELDAAAAEARALVRKITDAVEVYMAAETARATALSDQFERSAR